jgi:hypothetical protein
MYTCKQTVAVSIISDETVSYNNYFVFCFNSSEILNNNDFLLLLEFGGSSTARGPTPARTAHACKSATAYIAFLFSCLEKHRGKK